MSNTFTPLFLDVKDCAVCRHIYSGGEHCGRCVSAAREIREAERDRSIRELVRGVLLG